MQQIHHPLLSPALGTQRHITSMHFGQAGSGRKAYIQSSLHADELPGMLTAHKLRGLLEAAERRGEVTGEVVLVPVCNPIGLDQSLMHHQVGRFELMGMENFNRNYPDFFNLLKERIAPLLTQDPQANKRVVRKAMHEVLGEQTVMTELESQRKVLMHLSCDADLVLDLHCDFEAVLHMYVEEPMLDQMTPLARLLGARALLWARGSGPSISFDEALSGPWWRLQEHFAGTAPIPLACASTTVELRGQTDVSDALASQDADAIMAFLRHAGILAGQGPALPEPLCEATPLSGTESLHAGHPGVVDFLVQPGDRVAAGQLMARIVDPLTPRETEIRSSIDGVVYARHNLRWATAGMEICRVAGKQPIRFGNLLSP
ncbi:MAG: succinylglutamate desuccinylase/aspartoacylase family protein [Hydrogenophaga sp.]|nr:succinylglutamate desuccinylase/aspartoacylase family protein [Hydrogenophaga sp.]